MTARGESIYKASERIRTYGVEAFVKMLGKKAIKKRGGEPHLLKYYAEKYPEAPMSLKPKGSYISQTMRSYWRDVKRLGEVRDLSIKDTRKLLKSLKTDRNVQVRVIKSGEGWQLVMVGLYENTDKDNPYFKQQEESTGHSYVHQEQDYEEAFGECMREAQALLGGSGWQLVKVLKETWLRYYGREG